MKNERVKLKVGWRVVLVALIITFHLSPFTLSAQCDVKLKASDSKAFDKAMALFEQRQYKESAQQMRRLAGRNQHNADIQFWLGMTAVKDGFNTAGIRRYFTKCISLCPDYSNALAHFYMGMIHYTDERYDEAVTELEKYFAIANGSNERTYTAVYEEASNYLYWSQFLADAMLNQVPFDPVKVAGVSSKYDEALPYLTPDGRYFYFLRRMPVEHDRTSFYSRQFEEMRWWLYCSKFVDSAFSRGAALTAPFNQGDMEGSVTLTSDGNTLFYSVIRNQAGYSNSDIYFSNLIDGHWQPIENAGTNVNGARTWESQPSVTPDGQTLYFASNRQGGQGGTDIWRCRRLKNGDWSRPENLGPNINTPGNEKFPFIAADGHTLYFSSDGWQGFGGYDIYFANVNDVHGNRPINLGLPINGEGDDLSFGVTADGNKAYYVGKTDGSRSTDVMMFDLYPAGRPEPMRCAPTSVVDTAGKPLEATLQVKRAAEALYRSGADGRMVPMLSMQDDNLVTVTAEGMLPYVAELSGANVARGRMLPARITLMPARAGAVAVLPDAVSSNLRMLDGWVDYLIDNPRIHLSVECPKQADAKVLYDYLISHKLRAERLSFRGGTDVKHPQLVVK